MEQPDSRDENADPEARLRRLAADFANYRRRSEQERATVREQATAGLVTSLLEVLDSFERALGSADPDCPTTEGLTLIQRQLGAALAAEGLVPIHAVGSAFDPEDHEALEVEERSDIDDGTVTAVRRTGYRLRGRLLRPALVRVSRRP